MKRQRSLITFAAVIAVLVSVSIAGAFDTSPYLVGIWEDSEVISTTSYHVVNPTTKPLAIYMLWYLADGSYRGCVITTIAANGAALFGLGGMEGLGEAGAVKFFAFPAGTRKFDPNAVIGGFQRKAIGTSNASVFNTEANLKAVTINSYTIGEFQSANCVF